HRFTVASGVCSPSRTAVMTGHFPARYNIDGHFAWVPSNAKRGMPDWLNPEAPMLPRFLKEAGYATAHYGKWHLANDMIPDSPTLEVYGYDDYGAFNCAGEQMPWHEDSRRSVEFMEQAVEDGKPFFINLWMHEPHTPFHTLPKYMWRFKELEDERDQVYASVLSHADDRVGEVLDALDRLKIADNTLVIFSSDNGPARATSDAKLELKYDTATGAGWGINGARGITGGRKAYKGGLFEGGIGVPFLARWPGKIAADKIDDQSLISAVDLLPTFCELAGVELPKDYQSDGVSQVEVLKGKPAAKRDTALFWKIGARWPAPKDRPEHWVAWAVVHDHWKLVSSFDFSHMELYDMSTDPLEQKDVAEAQPETVKSLKAQLDAWIAELPEKPTGPVFSSLRDQPEEK
ncbi:MAG: sulfatase-like hydrolase/transferase, partial [Verrucomicrobiota bacterium]